MPKNIAAVDFVTAVRLNKSSTNNFIKLTILWTFGPWSKSSLSAPVFSSFEFVILFISYHLHLILLHSEWPKLHRVLAVLSAIRLNTILQSGLNTILPKKSLLLVACSKTRFGGKPSISIIQASCSTSFSPGNSGYPVYNSARMQPKLHMSIGIEYGSPNITSGDR